MMRTEIDFHHVLFIKPIANTQPSCPLFYLQGHMIMKDIATRTIAWSTYYQSCSRAVHALQPTVVVLLRQLFASMSLLLLQRMILLLALFPSLLCCMLRDKQGAVRELQARRVLPCCNLSCYAMNLNNNVL